MQEKKDGRRWGLIGGVGVASVLALAALSNSQFAADTQTQPQSIMAASSATTTSNIYAIAAPVRLAATSTDNNASEDTKATTTPSTDNDLSNDRSYTNVSGHQVHSPAYDLDGDVPAGASARCGDGTYSFSQSHRGTCSHHGGVSQWL